MNLLRLIVRRLRALVRKEKLDTEMTEELRLHLELQTKANLAAGLSHREAQYAARRQFGGVEQIKEECREQRGVAWLENIGRDVRYAIRSLRRTPVFAAIVVLTLALGIGANTAIFSFFNGILLRPLPYGAPDRTVLLQQRAERMGELGFSPADFLDLQAHTELIEEMASYHTDIATLTGRGPPDSIYSSIVSSNFFQTLKARPQLGRAFRPEEGNPGAAR